MSIDVENPAVRETLEAFDPRAGLRNALGAIARERGDWAGIPMPLDGHPMSIEPRYPQAAEFAAIGRPEGADERPPGYRLRNIFWSSHLRADVILWNEFDTLHRGIVPQCHHALQDLKTMGISEVWGIEQEARALALLATLLTHHSFKQYLLTGMFIEESRRTGLHYVFRKLRPTVVLDARRDQVRIRCALCTHPIGYYEGSWAGAMCPTDDVIAHLMLMRGDEPLFWRWSNQHPAYRPEAGL